MDRAAPSRIVAATLSWSGAVVSGRGDEIPSLNAILAYNAHGRQQCVEISAATILQAGMQRLSLQRTVRKKLAPAD
jgi:hypothetical protein